MNTSKKLDNHSNIFNTKHRNTNHSPPLWNSTRGEKKQRRKQRISENMKHTIKCEKKNIHENKHFMLKKQYIDEDHTLNFTVPSRGTSFYLKSVCHPEKRETNTKRKSLLQNIVNSQKSFSVVREKPVKVSTE